MWWDASWHGGYWIWIVPLVFLVVMFLFCRTAASMCGRHGRRDREENAREILDRRFARGEISRDEHQRMLKDLERSRASA
jgi:putative membrane protein